MLYTIVDKYSVFCGVVCCWQASGSVLHYYEAVCDVIVKLPLIIIHFNELLVMPELLIGLICAEVFCR